MGRPKKELSISLEKVEQLAGFGLKAEEIAAILDISKETFFQYLNPESKYYNPDFSDSISRGNEKADARVKKSLFQRATGYDHEDMQFFQNKGEIIPVKYIKHHIPDFNSIRLWLMNRKAMDWKDKQDHDVNHNFTFADLAKIAGEFDEKKLIQELQEGSGA